MAVAQTIPDHFSIETHGDLGDTLPWIGTPTWCLRGGSNWVGSAGPQPGSQLGELAHTGG